MMPNENDYLRDSVRLTGKHCLQGKDGFSLVELLVSLAVLSLMTLALFNTGFSNHETLSQTAYEKECEKIFYALLQYQNEAIMDGYRRQLRFLGDKVLIIWTRDGVFHSEKINVKTMTFTGSYTGSAPLTLHQHGTVSAGGTLYLNGFNGQVKKIVVQPGNGRIYLDE